MNRRVLVASITATALVAVTGVVIATAEQPKGAILIPGGQTVTDVLIRQKLQAEGYLDIRVVRQGRFFEAVGSRDGKTGKFKVDALTGRLADDDDDDD